MAAGFAVYLDETPGEHATVEVRTQLSLHESRDGCTPLSENGNPELRSLEVLLDALGFRLAVTLKEAS